MCGHTDGILRFIHNRDGRANVLVNLALYERSHAQEMREILNEHFNVIDLNLSRYDDLSWAYINFLQIRPHWSASKCSLIIVPGIGDAFISDAEAILAICESYQYIDTDDKALSALSEERIKKVNTLWESEESVNAIQAVLDKALENPDTMWDDASVLHDLDDLIFGTDESGELYGAYDAIYELLYDEEWLALIRYPEDFTNLGVMKDFGNQNNAIVSMWDSVKASGGWDWTVAGICLGVCFALILGFALIFILKTKVFYGRYRKVN